MKLDGDWIKRFVLAHGEKVVLGVVGLIATGMVAFAFVGKKSVGAGQSPEEIRRKASDELGSISDIPPWIPDKETFGCTIAIDPARFNGILLAENMQPKRRRPEPEFVPAGEISVQVVRGHLGVGAIADAGAGAAPNVKGFQRAKRAAVFRAAIVTGLVPLGLQRSRYDDAFLDTLVPDAFTGSQNAPEYYRCILERAEVRPGVADDPLAWKIVNEADNDQTTDEVRDPALKREMVKWAGVIQPDLVDPSLVEPWLAYPNARRMPQDAVATDGVAQIDQWLPPILLFDWKRESVVHPAIVAAREKAVQRKPAANETAAEGDDTEKIAKFAASYPFRMLRCYDFSIQPGKKYKYRVVLVLRNPNRGIDEAYLQIPSLKDGHFSTAPPSEPSAVVQVPADVQVLAGGGVPAGSKRREPGVTLLVTVLADTQEALAAAKKKADDFRGPRPERERRQQEVEILAAAWGNVDQVWAAVERIGTRGMFLSDDPAKVDTSHVIHPISGLNTALKDIRVKTGYCLVDFTSGPKKTAARGKAKAIEPTQILLLDPDGRLVIRHEAEDAAAYEQQKPQTAPPPEKPPE